jgi:ABC-type uncharacterized transport system permease subunit
MQNVKSAKVKLTYAIVISLLAAILASAIATVISASLIKHENEVFVALATVIIGIAAACITAGISFAVVGNVFKSKFTTACAILLLYFTVVAALAVCVIFFIKWWVALILAVIMLPVPLLAILLLYGNNTVLVFDNEKSDYVDYKTRQSLKENAPEKEEELPQLKSFK